MLIILGKMTTSESSRVQQQVSLTFISSLNGAILVALLTYFLNHAQAWTFSDGLRLYGSITAIYTILFFSCGVFLISICFLSRSHCLNRISLSVFTLVLIAFLTYIFFFNRFWYGISVSEDRLGHISIILFFLMLYLIACILTIILLHLLVVRSLGFDKIFHCYAILPLLYAIIFPIAYTTSSNLSTVDDKEQVKLTEKEKLLIIGIDGFDPRIGKTLANEGQLPVIRKLFDTSVYGDLKTHIPTSSPVIWTSIATGLNPAKHGIRDFVTYKRVIGNKKIFLNVIPRRIFFGRIINILHHFPKPISSLQRGEKTFWEIMNEYSISTGIVNWWATIPVQPVHGFIVSNFLYGLDQFNINAIMKQASSFFYPNDTIMSDCIREAGKRLPKQREFYVSRISDDGIETVEDRGVNRAQFYKKGVLRNVAIPGDCYYIELVKSLFKQRQCDVLGVYLNGLDITEHLFWPDEEPDENEHIIRIGDLPAEIINYYQWMDVFIGTMLKQFPERRLLILSDHGMQAIPEISSFYYRWVKEMPYLKGYHEFAPPGFFLLHGNGIKEGVVYSRATVFDIAPTLLYITKLPISDKMVGKPLLHIISDECKNYLGAARYTAYSAVDRSLAQDYSPTKFVDMLEHLKKLGYIE